MLTPSFVDKRFVRAVGIRLDKVRLTLVINLTIHRYHILRVCATPFYISFCSADHRTSPTVSGTRSPTPSAAGVETVLSTSSTRVRVRCGPSYTYRVLHFPPLRFNLHLLHFIPLLSSAHLLCLQSVRNAATLARSSGRMSGVRRRSAARRLALVGCATSSMSLGDSRMVSGA